MSEDAKPQEIQAEDQKQPENVEQVKRTITIDTIHNDEALRSLRTMTETKSGRKRRRKSWSGR